jgi:hypothetical protein
MFGILRFINWWEAGFLHKDESDEDTVQS